MRNAINHRVTQWAILIAVVLVVTFAVSLLIDKAYGAPMAPVMMCSSQYDYPGCTVGQRKNLEAGTTHRIVRHYRHHRWGQSHHEWRNMPRRVNRDFAHKYAVAVARYERNHNKTAKATAPYYRTWAGFKANTTCAGSFDVGVNSLWGGWCSLKGATTTATDWVRADNATHRFVVKCSGAALVGMGTGAAGGVWFEGIGAVPGATAGGVLGIGSCTGQTIWDMLG